MSFLRIGRIQLSWCVCTGNARRAKTSRAELAKAAYFRGYDRALARFGWNYETRTQVAMARQVVEATRELRNLAA
jgi:hypothetical protein